MTEPQGQNVDNIIKEDNIQIEALFHKLDLEMVSVNKAVLLEEEEEEENVFAKKAGCQKGLQPINADYRKHKHY